MRKRIAALRTRLERLLLWRVWERMLEIEFVDRSVALAGKAFVSFFPLVIVVAAFVPGRIRSSIITTVTSRLGIEGQCTRDRQTSASRRRTTFAKPPGSSDCCSRSSSPHRSRLRYSASTSAPGGARLAGGAGAYWRGLTWLLVILLYTALLGVVRNALGGPIGVGFFVLLSLVLTTGMWLFSAWFFLMGDVRSRVLVPTGVITGIALTGFAVSATIWMPSVVTSNEAQFGFFGVALALVTWFSGAAICILIGACSGPVFADDTGWVGAFVRGGATPR